MNETRSSNPKRKRKLSHWLKKLVKVALDLFSFWHDNLKIVSRQQRCSDAAAAAQISLEFFAEKTDLQLVMCWGRIKIVLTTDSLGLNEETIVFAPQFAQRQFVAVRDSLCPESDPTYR